MAKCYFPIRHWKEKIYISDTCNICLEECFEGLDFKLTKCNHHFHWSCLQEWLNYNNNCPDCRCKNPTKYQDSQESVNHWSPDRIREYLMEEPGELSVISSVINQFTITLAIIST